ncbi:MAG: energy transducer TonB [Pseudomonadota bacterium]
MTVLLVPAFALADDLVPETVVEKAPVEPTKVCQPTYPRKALLEGIMGYVVMTFDINEHGRPVNIEIVESSPPDVFDLVSIRAFRCFQFRNDKQTEGHRYTLEYKVE